MKFRRFTSILVSAGLAFPQALLAQAPGKLQPAPRIPSVAVVDLSIPEGESQYRNAIRAAFLKAFSEDRRVRLIPPENVSKWRERERRAQAEAPPSEDLREARELLADGKKAYEKLRFDRAVKLLAEARREFILKLPALRSNRDLIDAHLYLGITYVALKETKKGQEEFRRVVYLDPKRELSARDFSPPVLEVFSKARQEVMATEPIRVKIGSEPPGANVFLNGRAIGKTPMETRLQPGEYFLLMEKKGVSPWYKPVPLQKRTEEVHAVLEPDAAEMKWGHLFRVREGVDQQSGDLGTVQEMAGSVGADLVFFGRLERMRDYRLMGQLYDSRTSELTKVAVATTGPEVESAISAAPDVVEAVLNFIRPDGRLVSEGSPDLNIPPEGLTVGGADRPAQPLTSVAPAPPKAWYERWWIYPIILGVGAGIYFGATQIGGKGGSKVVIDNSGNF